MWFLELSEVLWTMVLKLGLGSDNYIGSIKIAVIFAVWAGKNNLFNSIIQNEMRI